MTERDRNDALCGILQDSGEVMRILTTARRDIDAGMWSVAWTRLQHAGRHCEQVQVREIEMLFDKRGNLDKAEKCERCGCWNIEDGYCPVEDCEQLEADRRAELEADRKLGDWDAEDMRAGLPSRA